MRTKLTVFVAGALTAGTAQATPAAPAAEPRASVSKPIELAWLGNTSSNSSSNSSSNNGRVRQRIVETYCDDYGCDRYVERRRYRDDRRRWRERERRWRMRYRDRDDD